LGLRFELKGGTSLSKGYQIIDRFSEDVDIRIEPPEDQDVKTGRNHLKEAHIKSRKGFYDWLARTIKINGITKVERDTEFDNKDFFSAGIRLHYESIVASIEDLRDGVLLEAGFANVTPNAAKDMSSWAYDYAVDKADIIDNRARAVACYDPGYTLVEKLQTISTKFRKQQQTGELPSDFMRHYYDVYCLLRRPEVQGFIGTEAYKRHKQIHFPKADNQDIAANEAFRLGDAKTRAAYARAYEIGHALYYKGRPTFEQILEEINASIDIL